MKNVKSQSFGELEALYTRQCQYWVNKQREHEKAIEECQQKVASVASKPRRTQRKRRRRGPVREAVNVNLGLLEQQRRGRRTMTRKPE